MRRPHRSATPLRSLVVAALLGLAACGDSATQPGGSRYQVTVTPASVELFPGETQTFTASVAADPPDSTVDPSVSWGLVGDGSLSSDGVYLAGTAGSASHTQVGTVVATHGPSGTTGSATVRVPSADDLAGRGWTAFTAGDPAGADDRFDDALVAWPAHVDARTGKGWVLLRGGDYAGAETWFADAVLQAGDPADPRARDALAGEVLAWAGIGDPDRTRQSAEALLALEPDYVFSHDPTVSASDIHWLAARAALDVGDREGCVPHLDVLQPGHGLDPADPGFVEDALALLAVLAPAV